MRVGILSYPMLFQREGGLQIQVRETIAALNGLQGSALRPLSVELVNPYATRLDNYDLIHVFAAINGNYRIVEVASELGVPVVLSPLLSPGWNRANGFCARMADRLAGRLTAWNVQTSYAQTKRALQLSQIVIALGAAEREAIIAAFAVAQNKIRVLPNGINPQFFSAKPELFRASSGLRKPFVLMCGAISPYKNQLGLVQALSSTGLELVLIGACQRQDQPYLQEVMRHPHVRWLGQMEHGDPMLASAYAAAAVLALPSQGEVMPLAVLEALAAGTPAVVTRQSALQLPDSAFCVKPVAWNDSAAICRAVTALIASEPDRVAVRALVKDLSWQQVAMQIAQIYFRLVPARKVAAHAV